ncbi:hypothetical protein [Shewanella algae]|uniref:hypothetical protein n=1 Tax=Shewanella algae TaxID=38313 RepID=UPI001F4763AE|nr:hypothetical protein [Shewanella algae]MCE9785387.1 hypothetical protein [Shewanella algae]
MNLLLLSNHQSARGREALAFVIAALGLKGQAGGYIGSEPDPEGGATGQHRHFIKALA